MGELIDRVKKIMADDGSTPAAFADKIKVDRGTISHILSGRNKPSLDVVLKILKIFKLINSDWLLTGEGYMYKNEKAFIEPDIFDENPINPVNLTDKIVDSQEKGDKSKEIYIEKTVIQKVETPVFTSRKLDKIMILYSDKTYESFSPDK
jgi:transcriptional regulator with XRE-family HTH domain